VQERNAACNRCAQAIVEATATLGIEVRAVLHTGEVVRADDQVTGVAVHVGARVSSMAGAATR
jgi:class 3 adenylate cyclase